MKLFPVIVLIVVCLLITIGTTFGSAIFSSANAEGNSTYEGASVQQFGIFNAWVIVISALCSLAVIVLGLKLFRDGE